MDRLQHERCMPVLWKDKFTVKIVSEGFGQFQGKLLLFFIDRNAKIRCFLVFFNRFCPN